MNCTSKCPYRVGSDSPPEKADEIRNRCLTCKVCSEANTMQLGGRGMVYADGARGGLESVVRHSVAAIASGGTSRPPLPPPVWDRFRDVIRAWLDLSAVETMLLHHLANGGNLANFTDYADGLVKSLSSYKNRLDKRTAYQIWRRTTKRFRPFDALFIRNSRNKLAVRAILHGRG